MRTHFLGLLFVVLVGCGGSNAGGGTGRLFVNGVARTDDLNSGTFAVEVREGHRDGTLLTDATVLIRGDTTGEFTLPWEGATFGSFRLGANIRRQLAWDTGWQLEVRHGDDELWAYIEAPGATTITEPIADSTFDRSAGKPMVIRWKDGQGRRAEIVTVDFKDSNDADRELSEDPLELEVDANRLKGTNSERLQVIRKNEIKLEGGTPGSILSATTEHQIRLEIR